MPNHGRGAKRRRGAGGPRVRAAARRAPEGGRTTVFEIIRFLLECCLLWVPQARYWFLRGGLQTKTLLQCCCSRLPQTPEPGAAVLLRWLVRGGFRRLNNMQLLARNIVLHHHKCYMRRGRGKIALRQVLQRMTCRRAISPRLLARSMHLCRRQASKCQKSHRLTVECRPNGLHAGASENETSRFRAIVELCQKRVVARPPGAGKAWGVEQVHTRRIHNYKIVSEIRMLHFLPVILPEGTRATTRTRKPQENGWMAPQQSIRTSLQERPSCGRIRPEPSASNSSSPCTCGSCSPP